jgi:hypothetical protein
MKGSFISAQYFCILSGISAIIGVLMLVTSFLINAGPPPNATMDQLIEFGHQNFNSILWGAWLQAIGPVFIVLFAFAIVYLSGATRLLAGWMTLFGASTLMTVSLIEISFYICVLFKEPAVIGPIGMDLISSVQHLYFIVAAPAFFIPLGFVIVRSEILPRVLGFLAIALGIASAVLGITSLLILVLPLPITAFGVCRFCGGYQLQYCSLSAQERYRTRQLNNYFN